MKIVSRTTGKKPVAAPAPRSYFVHIPKTAGITLKTFLENNYARGESLVIDEWEARQLPPEELRKYRLLSGHYSSEVLDALGERPDVTLMLVREPVGRFRSWVAHCRRVSHQKYRQMCEGRTDEQVLTGPDGYTCRQAHWLARAVRYGADYNSVPAAAELESLLAQVDIAGVTDEIERFMQLVAYRMEWPAPQPGWHINRRPELHDTPASPAHDLADADVRRHLAIDQQLYEAARTRFWEAYALMLSAISVPSTVFTPETAAGVPVDTVQCWLRSHYEASAARKLTEPVASIAIDGDRPAAGEGWSWRESPVELSYRWTGPETRATLVAAPLVEDSDYLLTLEAMGAADWPTWEGVTLEINGLPIEVVRERLTPRHAGGVALRLRARFGAAVVAAQNGLTRLTIAVPQTKQALTHVRIEESFDTFHHDRRAVGLAVHSVRIERTAARVLPSLTLRWPPAA